MPVLNTRQYIASVRPTTTTEQQLYVVPASTEIDGFLRICNQDSTARTYRVAHCTPGHGDTAITDNSLWIFYDKSIAANTTEEISIHAKATETIRVKVSYANVISFHLSGNVKVTS